MCLFRISRCCLTENTQVPAPPHFDSRSRIFELDSCGGNGKVCLVYKNCTPGVLFTFTQLFDGFLLARKEIPNFAFWVCFFFLGVVAQQSEIWFLDRSLCWHFLSASFTSYYRLMITHLGLPEWQYSFTPYGPSPQAKVPAFTHQVLLKW